jgi:hypothetical protein
VETGELPESVLCASFAERPSTSRLNGLDRKTLLKLFEEDERVFGGRNEAELKFWTEHDYWPDLGPEESAKYMDKHFERIEEVLNDRKQSDHHRG